MPSVVLSRWNLSVSSIIFSFILKAAIISRVRVFFLVNKRKRVYACELEPFCPIKLKCRAAQTFQIKHFKSNVLCSKAYTESADILSFN